MPLQKIISHLLVGAGSAYVTDRVASVLGRSFKPLKFIEEYRSQISHTLNDNLNGFYRASCSTVSSTAQFFAISGSCTLAAYTLSALKIIPIKTRDVWTLASITTLTVISYKIYRFFSQIKNKEVIQENPPTAEIPKSPKIPLDQSVERYAADCLDQLSRQIVEMPRSHQRLPSLQTPDIIVQPIQVRTDAFSISLKGFLLKNQHQTLAVFPLTINQIPCLFSVTQKGSAITRMEFWQLREDGENGQATPNIDVKKTRIGYSSKGLDLHSRENFLPISNAPADLKEKMTVSSASVTDYMSERFAELNRSLENKSRRSSQWIREITQRQVVPA